MSPLSRRIHRGPHNQVSIQLIYTRASKSGVSVAWYVSCLSYWCDDFRDARNCPGTNFSLSWESHLAGQLELGPRPPYCQLGLPPDLERPSLFIVWIHLPVLSCEICKRYYDLLLLFWIFIYFILVFFSFKISNTAVPTQDTIKNKREMPPRHIFTCGLGAEFWPVWFNGKNHLCAYSGVLQVDEAPVVCWLCWGWTAVGMGSRVWPTDWRLLHRSRQQ